MRWDEQMTTKFTLDDGSISVLKMRPGNTNLNEDLALVTHLFCDKTGTLTQNNMELAKFFVNGHVHDEMSEPGQLWKTISDPNEDTLTREQSVMLARCVALCHEVFPTKDSEGDVKYQGKQTIRLIFAT